MSTKMHAERFETLPRPRDDLRELFAALAGYRWRLGAEVVSRFVLRGLMVGAGLLALASTLSWLTGLGPQPVVFWLAILLPPLTAVRTAIVHWPSARQTARTADRRPRLDERLATPVELSNPRRGGALARGPLRCA
jgi:hypothetical protein